MSILLQTEHLTKTYASKDGSERVTVFSDLSCQIPEGKTVSIVGSSGCGKSTLLHLMGGLDAPDSGRVLFRNTELHTLKGAALAKFRNTEIGFVFQFHHLLPEFTALENVMMPGLIMGKSSSILKEEATSLLDRFGLAKRYHHRPTELSGGEQQRVSVARAIINKPALLLADEPTGNLDEKNTNAVLDLLYEIQTETGLTMVLVTHDPTIAQRSDIILEMTKGKLNAR